MSTPAFLATSYLLSPFVRLAQTTHRALSGSFEQSTAARAINGFYQAVLLPVHQRFESMGWLHQTLRVLNLVAACGILVLATFASTEVIGAAVVLTFGILIFRMLLKPIALKPNIIDALVVLFFLTALVSTAFSSYVQTSVVGLVKFLVFFIGYLNFRLMVAENRRQLFLFLGVLLALGIAESFIGFYQYINHVQPLATWQDMSVNPEDRLTRIFGTLKPYNPNLLAGFLIPPLAIGVGLAWVSVFKKRWLQGVALFLVSMPVLAALVLTGSRGGYLAILAMATLTFMLLGHLLWHDEELKDQIKLKAAWILVLLGSILGSVAMASVVPAIRNRFLSIFAMREDSSNSYRLNVWNSTIEMIKDNWLVGIGPGNDTFKQVYGLYMVPGYNALSAYSIFLEIWAEQGIMGFIVFLLLLVTVLMRTCLAFYGSLPAYRKMIIGMLFVGIVGSVLYGLFDTIWYRPSVNLLFWLLVAGFAVYSEQAIEEGSQATVHG